MTQRIRWALVTAGVLVFQPVWPLGQCHGGPLLDWLLGRTPYYAPWGSVAYYPPASVTAPPAWCTPLRPPAAVAPPPAVAAPVYPPAAAVPAAPVVASYAPQVRYRTTWVPVPVTYYRPVVSVDPATGCPTTGLQPCNSYSWQLRRVPVVSYRPTYSCWLRDLWAPAAPALVAPAAVPADPCGVPLAPCCPDMSGATLAPAPATTPPAPWAPATTVPGASPAPAPTPADTRPSLDPGTIQPGASAPQMRLAPPSGAPNAAGNEAKPSAPGPAAHVKPIPDPQGDSSALPSYEPPRLLNPRDRTAFHTRWVVVPISWPGPLARPEPRASAASVRPSREWDDSGWVSASGPR